MRLLPNEKGFATVVLDLPLGVARPLDDGVAGLEFGAEREASGEVLVVGGEEPTDEAAEVRSLLADALEAGVELADEGALRMACGLVDVLGFLTASTSPSLAAAAAVCDLGIPLLGTGGALFLAALTLLDTLPVLPLRLRLVPGAPSLGVVGFNLVLVGLVRAELGLPAADREGLTSRTGEVRVLAGDLVVDSTRGRALASEAAVGAAAVECLRWGVPPKRTLSALVVEFCDTAESLLATPVGEPSPSVDGNGTPTGGGELHSGEPGADSLPPSAWGDDGVPRPSTWTPRSLSAEPGTASGTTSIVGFVTTGARTGWCLAGGGKCWEGGRSGGCAGLGAGVDVGGEVGVGVSEGKAIGLVGRRQAGVGFASYFDCCCGLGAAWPKRALGMRGASFESLTLAWNFARIEATEPPLRSSGSGIVSQLSESLGGGWTAGEEEGESAETEVVMWGDRRLRVQCYEGG